MSRILVISFTDLGSDARVGRQIEFLRERHDVVAAGLGPPRADVEFVDLTLPPRPAVRRQVHRVQWGARLAARRMDTAYWGFPQHRHARERLSSVRTDLVVANDVEALPLGRWAAGEAPVVLDAHEWAIAQYEHVWWWRVLIRPHLDALLREHLPHVAGMMTVAPGIAERYEQRYGVQCRVVTNAAPYVDLRPTPVDSPIRLLHHGGAHPVRKLELMIQAVRRLDGRMSLDLALLPNDPRYLRRLKDEVAGDEHVRVLGPIPMEEIIPRANSYDAGVIFYPPIHENLELSLPNKLFDFLQARLAVVVGPSPEMSRIIEDFDCGVVARSFEVDALCEALLSLTAEALARRKQAAGEAAQVHCAERNRDVVLEVVEQALEGRRTGSPLP